MASSNIKLFDENKGNMLTDTEFNISTQRLNGLQTGVASSQLQNKAMYQASLVAYAIAQVMMQNGKNANDTDAVSAFVANLSGTMLQKVYDIATTAEAQAGVATGKWMSPALVKAAIDALAAKAQNILSDETKALFGLGTDAVPDDAFNVLSRFQNGLGNEYVWEKGSTQITYDTEDQSGWTITTDYTIYYADSYTVSGSNATLVNPKSVMSSNSSNMALAIGKFIMLGASTANYVMYIPSNATVITSGSQLGWSLWYKYTNIKSAFTHVDYVNSPDPNAYPPAVSDGYTYTPLGQLGAKVQIATGSYTGTGTYGSSNPNSLTFDFEPQIIFIANGVYLCILFPSAKLGMLIAEMSSTSNVRQIVSSDGLTVSWYVSNTESFGSSSYQMNNGLNQYIAIG